MECLLRFSEPQDAAVEAAVLILILMECLLRKHCACDLCFGRERLNPYSNGMLT